MCGKILCEWSDEIDGPVMIWVFPAAAMGKVGGRTDQNWPKSGEHQVTRRREDPEAVRPENLVKVEVQARLEGPGLTLQE